MFYFVFISLVFLYILKDKIKVETRLIISSVILLVVIWTRFGLGADYFSYNDIYDKLHVDTFSNLLRYYQRIDFGFRILIWPFRLLNIPFHLFFALLNSIILLVLLKWIFNNSEETSLSILLFYSMFYFVWVLSAARQSIVLAFGLYFLFDDKKTISLKLSCLIATILALFHQSAFFLIIYLLLGRINWSKTKHLIFLGVSIVISYIPVETILEFFSFIPSVNRILTKYISTNPSILSFSGIVRLLIFFLIFAFYDKLENKRRYVDATLFGFSLYFLMKFSELTAARGTIFSFLFVIILIPTIIKEINLDRILIYSLVITGSFLYFSKELNTMFNQAGYIDEIKWGTYPNVFKNDPSDFATNFSFEIQYRNLVNNRKFEFKSSALYKKNVDFDENHNYYLIYDNKYRFINKNGDIYDVNGLSNNSEIFEGILLTYVNPDGKFFGLPKFVDLTSKNRTREEMELKYFEYRRRNEFISEDLEQPHRNGFDMIPESIKYLYNNEKEINDVIYSRINYPFIYYIVRIDYYDTRTFIYLDENLELIFDFPTVNGRLFDEKGFLHVNTLDGTVIINEDGKVLWWN